MAAVKKVAAKTAKPAKTAKVAKEKVAKDQKNGVTRPKAGTTVGKIWDICDKLSTLPKSPASRADVLVKTKAAQINDATAATQYGKWRRYHGITGRVGAAE